MTLKIGFTLCAAVFATAVTTAVQAADGDGCNFSQLAETRTPWIAIMTARPGTAQEKIDTWLIDHRNSRVLQVETSNYGDWFNGHHVQITICYFDEKFEEQQK